MRWFLLVACIARIVAVGQRYSSAVGPVRPAMHKFRARNGL
jgi:hypothetical protein